MTNALTFEGLTEPRQWLRLAETRAHEGRYEDALRAHEFYHRHALEVEDSQYGVRLSFALAAWARLAGVYPAALGALQTLRREAAEAVVDAGDVERFSEALSVDQWLNDDDASDALIGAVEAAFPDTVSDFTEHRVLRILVERGEYERALRWIGDPWQSYATELELYGLPNPGIPDHEEWRRRSFVESVRRLVVILVGADRPGDAAAMAARASDVIDDPQLVRALDRVVAARPPT